jgi:nicotinamide mononucleotide transporter
VFPDWLEPVAVATGIISVYLQIKQNIGTGRSRWLVWIAVNVVYIWMFIFKHLYLTAGLYAVFFVLAVMGYLQWRRSYRADPFVAPAVAAA